MMSSSRTGVLVSAVLLFASAHAAAPGVSGAIFTTDQHGTITNANTQYLSKCGAAGVYLDGGPGPHASAKAASLPDGDYYFQVTDPSGKTLLSTDPVGQRCFTVASGVITGACPTGTHATFVNSDHAHLGARTVELCGAPNAPFRDSPNDGGEYKVWVTPAGDGTLAGGGFVGDTSLVDSDCSGIAGCFHGFRSSRSKTDNFKVRKMVAPPDTTTYCIRVEKQLVFEGDPNTQPGVGWTILVTDSAGATSTYLTDEQGSTADQICGLAAGTYSVGEATRGYDQIAAFLNGTQVGGPSVDVILGSSTAPGDQTVRFVNTPDSGS